MYYSTGKGLGKIVVVSCERGDKIIDSIDKALKKEGIDNAVILSGVATFENVHYHYVGSTAPYPEEHYANVTGAYEVANLDGLILHGVPHIHFAACDRDKVIGAHLEPETTALYLAEIVLAEIIDLEPYERISYSQRTVIQD